MTLAATPPTPHRRYWEPQNDPKEEPVRRRRFIKAAAAATGISILPGTVLPAAALAVPNRLAGATTVTTALNDLTADIWNTGADYVDPASAPAREDLLSVAHWQWAQSVILASRTTRSPLYTQALGVEAEAARQLAMICADRRDYSAATRLYRQAAGAAERGGHHELLAWIQTSRAYMPLYGGRADRTIELATQALRALSKAQRPGGRAAVCAHALLARSYASAGDATRTHEAMRMAYGTMGRYRDSGSPTLPNRHHPQRFAWVKLNLASAEAYAALGDSVRHERAYDATLGDRSVSAMHKPMLDMGRAEVTRDPEAAATQTLTVLQGLDTVPAPLLGRARALAARAHAKDPRSQPVQELRVFLIKHR
jgi:hypothetical protein